MNLACLVINIWTDEDRELPDDLDEAFLPHAEHVAKMVAEGYLAGDINDEAFSGWWEIKRDRNMDL